MKRKQNNPLCKLPQKTSPGAVQVRSGAAADDNVARVLGEFDSALLADGSVVPVLADGKALEAGDRGATLRAGGRGDA